jgi:hypothetical protein
MMRTVLLIILVFCVVSFLFCLSLFFVLCSLLSVSLDYPTLFVSTIFSNLYCHLIIYDTVTHIISICSFQGLRLIETTWLVLLLAISPRVRYIVGSSPVGSNQRQCNFLATVPLSTLLKGKITDWLAWNKDNALEGAPCHSSDLSL